MMYCIVRNYHLRYNRMSPWRGAVTIWEGRPYYATNESKPVYFQTKALAQDAIDAIQGKDPEDIFQILDVTEVFQDEMDFAKKDQEVLP